MRQWIARMLAILSGAMVGVWLGRSLYTCWDVHEHPGLYAAQSAPWYWRIVLSGMVTLACAGLCLLARWILRRRKERSIRRGESHHDK